MMWAFRLLAMMFILLAAISPLGFSETKNVSFSTAKQKALLWLRSQMVPNDVVPDPQPERIHMIQSYRIPKDNPVYRYLYGRSMIYDNALAVIAFTMVQDFQNAAFILNTVKRLVREDGSLWFGYNVNNSWPSDEDHSGALNRTGSTAWAGYAALFYILRRQKEEPDLLTRSKEAQSFLKMARAIGNYLLSLRIKNDKDPRYGMVTGGKNTYSLKYEKNSVVEDFQEENIDWVSTEHNIDAYLFLKDLGRLSGDDVYIKAAEEIKIGLYKVWSVKDNQYYQGIKPGQIDRVLALDCASWGSIFSVISGKPDYAIACMTAIESNYKSYDDIKAHRKIIGYKPYASKEIFDVTDNNILKYYYPDHPGMTWKEMPGVWGEGSLGVAIAYLKLGRKNKAVEIINDILSMQAPDGGILYFTREIPHEFVDFPSVASTAWLIMVLSVLENEDLLKDFWNK
jgi:hypothetical protein